MILADICENARNTVLDFLYGIKIDHYVNEEKLDALILELFYAPKM